MNRLDRHVGMVRSKLTLERFFLSLGYAIAIFFAVVLLFVLVDRFFWFDLPRRMIWFWSAAAAAILAAAGYAGIHRPSPHQAAILIDAKLGLNEKFSTALYARSQGNESDPFVVAAVADAERTAESVSLHRRFPMAFPISGYFALGAAIFVFLIGLFLPRVDLFDHHAKQAAEQRQIANRIAAEQSAKSVLTAVNSLPAAVQNQAKLELAKKDLQRVLDQPNADPSVTKLTAMKAQAEADAARQEEMSSNPAVSQAQADKAVFNAMNPSEDDQGPVADASKAIADGDFSAAEQSLQQLQQKFDQMTPEQQKAAADQMSKLADQLKKIASDPTAMQHLQQQLQKQGATTQQSQQMTAATTQPQQLQQMQKQMSQKMTPQQQAQIKKTTQQMQAVANSQNKSQQMSKAAQQMAHGMQQSQAKKQGGTKPGQEQADAKTGDAQKDGPLQGGQTPSGKQGGTEQSPESKPGGQQPGGDQPGQGMQQGGQQMAQALNQMSNVQKDAQQQAAGQNPGDPAANGNQQGNNQGTGGQGTSGIGTKKSDGVGGPGSGSGGGQLAATPYTVKQETDPSQNITGGKVLSRSFVKADPLIGKSTIELSPQAKSALKESTDDVSDETVPRDAQKAVKDYFDTVQN